MKTLNDGEMIRAAKSVLLVEDDVETRDALTELLANRGFRVDRANDGQDALTQLRGGLAPDAIILDLRMPVMDGWEFRAQQKLDARFASVPVIAISADSSPQAAAVDAAQYLSKPFEGRALLDALDAALRAAEREQDQKRRLAQVHADRMSALGQLAAGTAHEINNPLAYVIGNLGFAAAEIDQALGLLDPLRGASGPKEAVGEVIARLIEARDALLESRSGAHRVREVVEQLRIYSRSGEEVTPVDMERVAESAIRMAADEIHARARLVRDYLPAPRVRANAFRLGQVFLNLLINAAQAIGGGAPEQHRIRVSVRPAADKNRVVAEIEDTGVGIPPELLNRIFDPFFTTKPVGVGTGLGLPMCMGLVRAVGGELTVDSRVGKGTVFRVTLPAWEGAVEAEPLEPAATAARRARVLVIDDEPMIGAVVRRTLGDHHEVSTCVNGKEALLRLRAGDEFDVLLCDLMMPEMTGMELYEELGRVSPQHQARVVFLTGGAFTDSARTFLERVPNERLGKPFTVSQLRAVIDRRLT